ERSRRRGDRWTRRQSSSRARPDDEFRDQPCTAGFFLPTRRDISWAIERKTVDSRHNMASDLTFSRNNTAQTKGRAQPGAPTTDGRENVVSEEDRRPTEGLLIAAAVGAVIYLLVLL